MLIHAMPLLRRFLVVAALMFWHGGFTFYAAVVVPLGQEIVGKRQGFLTREVTDYLNLSGGVALLLSAWDVAAAPDRRWRRSLRWGSWVVMAVSLAALVWLHPHMDQYLELDSMRIVDRPGFRFEHRWYLWISTVQWGAGLVYLLLMLVAWRCADRRALATSRQQDTLETTGRLV